MATIYDVARRAEVSIATVSFVVNNGPKAVSEATRKRVLAAMEELQYRPSGAARGLARRRMFQLGVYFAGIGGDMLNYPFVRGLLQGAIEVSDARGYDTLLLRRRSSPADEALHSGRVDGVLLMIPPDHYDTLTIARGLPLVTVAGAPPPAEATWLNVGLDNAAGMRLALEHLVTQGHRRIGHITGNLKQNDARVRRDTFVALAHELGLEEAPMAEGTFSHEFWESNYQAAHRLLERSVPPTAVIAACDPIACVVEEVARERGQKIALVGFDDIGEAPGISSIRQPLREMGELAAGLLVDLIEQGTRPVCTDIRVTPELIVRGSTAEPVGRA
ncbi:LacI family DNA-binding transcriptional regulator [Armatimonas sp.]|uniref:LacI family DNA-binding transcriptional regulator n=1 Tax=Armatimonas sp. TaxID=1872638 RepID=UPI00286BBAC7|nr:LacI family DNA-binding transcriptional regulator [Armatimonas sp.]